jgi:hypothetical protein
MFHHLIDRSAAVLPKLLERLMTCPCQGVRRSLSHTWSIGESLGRELQEAAHVAADVAVAALMSGDQQGVAAVPRETQ